jgi:hypothetical protein
MLSAGASEVKWKQREQEQVRGMHKEAVGAAKAAR